MKQIIAMHGWAGHAGLWDHWQRTLEKQGWSWQSADRGYGAAPPSNPHWHPQQGQRVLIAHSLGLHLVPEEQMKAAEAVVLLGCFTTFVESGKAGRATKAGLQGMRAALGSSGETDMLHRFFQKAGAPLPIHAYPPSPLLGTLSEAGRLRLEEDLSLLECCKGLPASWPRQAHVLTVHGAKDAVVSEACHRQLLEALRHQNLRVQTDPSWGHALITPQVLSIVNAWLQIL